ncbi:MAG: gamma-glutamylcyclotransferase [Dehalococcoidales bacterium]|nr:gamma-glutamylcyclotransferase [Dehalococcoidales bacterium]
MYYFAYGSNLSKKQMQERCPDSRPLFVATLPNYKLVFSGWSRKWMGSVATIKSFRGEKVRGALYEVSDASLRQLDKHETGYTRQNVTVFDEDNEAHQAVTYIKSGQLEESVPSQRYGEVIRQGYKDWGLI